MKCNVVVILGLLVVAGSGCGREASERFRPDRFVREKKPSPSGPLPVSAPKPASQVSSSEPVDFALATGAHGPGMSVRAQMLEMKEANAGTNVLGDVKTAFREGMTSELLNFSSGGAGVFADWLSSLDTEVFQLSRLRLSRDAQFDRVEKTDGNGRLKIRRYEVSFGGAEFVGWIEVKRSGKRWIIVGAGSYTLLHDPTEETDPSTEWFRG